jgi:hypothetical protein
MRRASLASAIRNSQTILYGGKDIFVLILKMLFLLKETASEVLILLLLCYFFKILICFLDRIKHAL